ncbi:DUF6368 family protein [Streptomyces sp. 147326]|uniref:DUF6368 family protein n=1 Tax=Streptomyces sp. 147326 TaxID=3074379 RepID=UPI003857AD2F
MPRFRSPRADGRRPVMVSLMGPGIGLSGPVAVMTDPWPAAYGSAEFLRAWTRRPGFRLLK